MHRVTMKWEGLSAGGLYGFRINGTDKVTSSLGDGDPMVLGRDVLEYVAQTSLKNMQSHAQDITLLDKSDSMPAALFNQYQQCAGSTYLNLRNDGLRYMIDCSDSLTDSRSCSWVYIINLDDEVLEVYAGHNKNKDAAGRYASNKTNQTSEYHGVMLIESIPLSKITMDKIDMILTKLWDKPVGLLLKNCSMGYEDLIAILGQGDHDEYEATSQASYA